MTWRDLTTNLKSVRARGACEAHSAAALYELGYIEGSNTDAGGLTLTPAGRRLLDHIDHDTRQLDQELSALAHAFATVYGNRQPTLH